MSGTFVELGLLVLAAFGLGLFVGWLAWAPDPRHSPPPEPDPSPAPGDPDDAASPDPDTDADEGLPHWRAETLPTPGPPSRLDRLRPGRRDPTVMIRPRGWTAARRR